jgi:hypothetical protein
MNDTVAEPGTSTPDAGAEAQTMISEAAPQSPAIEQESAALPEHYAFQAPEGIELDTAATEEWAGLAKELKLSQADAQKAVDLAAGMVKRQQDAHADLVTSWTEQAKTDKEIGGDRLNENLAVAKRALEAFGTPELRDVLNMTGLGNHPEVIRAFYRAGMKISEDGFIAGAAKAGAVDMAKRMFPTMN